MTEIISRKMKTLGLKLNQMETLVSKMVSLFYFYCFFSFFLCYIFVVCMFSVWALCLN